jgi:hypothetical protein
MPNLTHPLFKEMAQRISSGLSRKAISSCSQWTEKYRVLGGKDFPGPWRFKHHPWLKEMHDSQAPFNVGKKAAQLGYTETVLNLTFYKIDIERIDCLYVLPSKTPDASDFSTGRFDPALELSPHLENLFSDVKNIGHKRAGPTNLYIRGSKSRSQLKSIPVGFLVLDEVDEMVEANIPLAMARQDGQLTKNAWAISTPTIPTFGIDDMYGKTSQEHFFFKCPGCSRLIELKFPESLIITGTDLFDPNLEKSHLICLDCKCVLPHKMKHEWLSTGRWVPSYTDRDDRGFYVHQQYSPTVSPYELAKFSIEAEYNPAVEQEYWNSKGGLAHTVDGAKLDDATIKACYGSYKKKEITKVGFTTMGVDIGKWIHYEIDMWFPPEYVKNDLNLESHCRVITMGKVQHFEDLDVLMKEYMINFCVVDANPERRKAFEFASRFWGYVKMCFYGRGIQGKQIHINNVESNGEPTITVDRTSWLDMSLGRFRSKKIDLPMDTDLEYLQHLKSLVRIFEKDQDGNPVAKYIKKERDEDHLAHARNYAEIALPFACNMGQSQDITDKVI